MKNNKITYLSFSLLVLFVSVATVWSVAQASQAVGPSNSNIDTPASGALNIGANTATSIIIGKSGVTTTFPGDVTVMGTLSATGVGGGSSSSSDSTNESTAAQLPKFRLALAKTRDGTQDTKILFVGDSITEGIGTTLTNTFVGYGSYPSRVSLGGTTPIANGLGIYNVADGRWTLGTGWAVTNGFGFCDGGNNAGVLSENAASGNLTFTPGATQGTFDSFTIYYLNHTGNGSVTATATGGSPTTINTNSSDSYGSVTVSAASAGTGNSVVIHPVSGQVFIVGVEPFLSTTATIRKGNVGVSGATSSQCGDNIAFGSLPAIRQYAPDLTVISLGTNDAASSVSSSSLSTNMQAIITAAQVSGDVVLVTMPPSQDSTRLTNELLYQSVYSSLSQTDGLPMVDIFKRFGRSYNAAFMAGDGLHGNQSGYWDIASAFDSAMASLVSR